MAENTFHLNFLTQKAATWLLNSTPFFPQIETVDGGSEGDSYNVTFNQGYIFDYAKGGEKIPVLTGASKGETSLSLAGDVEYLIKLRFVVDNGTGEIINKDKLDELKPRIIKDGTAAPSSPSTNPVEALKNLKIVNELADLTKKKTEEERPDDGTKPKGDHATIELDLCKIKSGNILELYIRENIHLWFRGFRVLRPKDDFRDEYGMIGDPTQVKSIIKFDDEKEHNGLLDIKSLFFPAYHNGNSNKLQVFDDGESIGLFVASSEVGPD